MYRALHAGGNASWQLPASEPSGLPASNYVPKTSQDGLTPRKPSAAPWAPGGVQGAHPRAAGREQVPWRAARPNGRAARGNRSAGWQATRELSPNVSKRVDMLEI